MHLLRHPRNAALLGVVFIVIAIFIAGLSILSILLLFISGGWMLMIAARSARTES